MNCKAKGSRKERAAARALETVGYVVTKAGGSLGLFDLVAVGPRDVKLIQVKAGKAPYLSGVEREQITALVVPPTCSKECWRYVDGRREPVIEVL